MHGSPGDTTMHLGDDDDDDGGSLEDLRIVDLGVTRCQLEWRICVLIIVHRHAGVLMGLWKGHGTTIAGGSSSSNKGHSFGRPHLLDMYNTRHGLLDPSVQAGEWRTPTAPLLLAQGPMVVVGMGRAGQGRACSLFLSRRVRSAPVCYRRGLQKMVAHALPRPLSCRGDSLQSMGA